MKKQLIIIVLILLAVGGMVLLSVQSGVKQAQPEGADTPGQTSNGAVENSVVAPSDISVGIFDPKDEPSEATRLLEARLTALGYKVTIVKTADAEQAASERVTLLFRAGAEDTLTTLKLQGIAAAVVRQIESSTIEQDILIVAWSFEDIDWGTEADLDTLRNVSPESVAILVLNAGAETGEAGRIADVLKNAGYTQAVGESSENEVTGPAVVYYRRNFRSIAKKLVPLLKSNGYADATYRARENQAAPLVIVLTAGIPTTTPSGN